MLYVMEEPLRLTIFYTAAAAAAAVEVEPLRLTVFYTTAAAAAVVEEAIIYYYTHFLENLCAFFITVGNVCEFMIRMKVLLQVNGSACNVIKPDMFCISRT